MKRHQATTAAQDEQNTVDQLVLSESQNEDKGPSLHVRGTCLKQHACRVKGVIPMLHLLDRYGNGTRTLEIDETDHKADPSALTARLARFETMHSYLLVLRLIQSIPSTGCLHGRWIV